ncbi:hypothetical protein BDR03DRAFT_462707 [Suillus americanus]|nr:hypothetical protein BDR03DRAFT_462707 [Suillus americanus]
MQHEEHGLIMIQKFTLSAENSDIWTLVLNPTDGYVIFVFWLAGTLINLNLNLVSPFLPLQCLRWSPRCVNHIDVPDSL